MIKFIALLAFVFSTGCAVSPHSEPLTYEEELACLSIMYKSNIFGDEIQKRPTVGGWPMPSPGEAVTPFESGDYIPKLKRIQTAAKIGNYRANAMLGELYMSGRCGVEMDWEKGREYMDKARNYEGMSFFVMIAGSKLGQEEEAKKEAYMWIKIGILRHPYINVDKARITLKHRGKSNPSRKDVKQFINKHQLSKEVLYGYLDRFEHSGFTRSEIIESEQMAQDWVRKHP